MLLLLAAFDCPYFRQISSCVAANLDLDKTLGYTRKSAFVESCVISGVSAERCVLLYMKP